METEALNAARAWPFVEARKLLARMERTGAAPAADNPVVFETGYGASGLPHIGTFGEVVRTAMVRHAFLALSPGTPTRLVCFSDDMDGLRKVPGNVPNQDMLRGHLDKPLTAVPDPFGVHGSFGAHNNARLCAFLDHIGGHFGFDYEFVSATGAYRAGRFDGTLLRVLAVCGEILEIILPTLGPERRRTYSPFLPISPDTGQVLMARVLEYDPARGAIVYAHPDDGRAVETPVTGGRCKLQWKADWAMRWIALGVDYEMAGKDLIDSVKLSGRICRVLGGAPPEGFAFELFLDENGEKISKSRGNGLTVEEWLRYASPESLALFMYRAPRKAKRLHFDVIPRAADEYLALLEAYRDAPAADRLENPVWHMHARPPDLDVPVSFSMLLNLVSAAGTSDREALWGFVRRYAPGAGPQTHPHLDQMVDYALAYYRDFVAPAKTFRQPSAAERTALEALADALEAGPADAQAMQTAAYEVGKAHGFAPLRDWFGALYEIVLGQPTGPRFGSFAALYGRAETVALVRAAARRGPDAAAADAAAPGGPEGGQSREVP